MNRVCLLYRSGIGDPEELYAARSCDLPVYHVRTMVPPNSLVIGRYSCLPHYHELVFDLAVHGSTLINTGHEHEYIANCWAWARDLGPELTPETWEYGEQPATLRGAFVLKGRTNSRKWRWKQRMFAPTAGDIGRIANSLFDDEDIARQGLVVRRYVPLRQLGEGINGLPIVNEHRVFILWGGVLASGFYWSTHPELALTTPPEAVSLALEAYNRLRAPGSRAIPAFVAIDVAEKADGGWLVIDVNDGQQSGLSMIDPHYFYGQLEKALERQYTI